jgi:hypothetical protein
MIRNTLLGVVALLALLGATCGEDPCSGGNLITVNPPGNVESVQIRDVHGVLWEIRSAVPRPLEVLHYGEVPPGFEQTVPPGSARPRPFVKGEKLYKHTVTGDRIFDHDGVAGSAASFCGGYYESAPRKKP